MNTQNVENRAWNRSNSGRRRNAGFSIFIGALLFLAASCGQDDEGVSSTIGGSQSPIGEVGNTISWDAVEGVSGTAVEVTALEEGVSTFTVSATSDNDTYLELIEMVPADRLPGTLTVDGGTVEIAVQVKITDQGVQVNFEDGTTLVLVDYDGDVGDTYAATVGGVALENEIIERSEDDDYPWGGMLIKAIRVRYASHSPGINYVDHIYNHKFGIVGLEIHFEDGSTVSTSLVSASTN